MCCDVGVGVVLLLSCWGEEGGEGGGGGKDIE